MIFAFGESIFHIAKAQGERIVVADGVTDDLRRESVSEIANLMVFHRICLPAMAQLDNAFRRVGSLKLKLLR